MILVLLRAWVPRMCHSTYTSYATGTSLLIRKGSPLDLIEIRSDRLGRYQIMACAIAGHPLLLINIDINPPFTDAVLQEIYQSIIQMPPAPICIMGDFNASFNPSLGKLTPTTGTTSKLAEWAMAYNLVGVGNSL